MLTTITSSHIISLRKNNSIFIFNIQKKKKIFELFFIFIKSFIRNLLYKIIRRSKNDKQINLKNFNQKKLEIKSISQKYEAMILEVNSTKSDIVTLE